MTALPSVPDVSHRQLDVDGLSVHVAEAGSGAPLVLLHGWPQHWYCWRKVVPLLSGRYRLIMPDLRGHGWTDAPRQGYDKEQLASDLLGLLDALDLGEVGMIGHDWGGWTGFLACLRAPERFRGLLALGIVHPFQRLDPAKVLEAWRGAYQVALSTPVLAERVLRASPRLVESAIRAGSTKADAFSAEDLRVYGEVSQEPARAHATVLLYRTFLLREVTHLSRYQQQPLAVPTRLVVGDHDPVASPTMLAGWEGHADDMEVEILPGVGHFVPEEDPQAVARHATALFA